MVDNQTVNNNELALIANESVIDLANQKEKNKEESDSNAAMSISPLGHGCLSANLLDLREGLSICKVQISTVLATKDHVLLPLWKVRMRRWKGITGLDNSTIQSWIPSSEAFEYATRQRNFITVEPSNTDPPDKSSVALVDSEMEIDDTRRFALQNGKESSGTGTSASSLERQPHS
ncbi:hypothetical protein RIF29_14090 [Crotalaria pallida]|uniref:Uncharacterized protein n=1 Tax=Crotalaria pallida TaxID=3830 RepID=A0AAN9FB44_CROPI